MDESLAGRLDSTGRRARALLGQRPAWHPGTESTEACGGPPGDDDTARLARQIKLNSSLGEAAANAVASDLVSRAQSAMAKLEEAASDAALTDSDTLALESVMYVRSRPALRVYDHVLESLKNYPGSELWQETISSYEDSIVNAAAATGAVIVDLFGSGNPPWVQGSAWLIAPDRVVTNRHVVRTSLNFALPNPERKGMRLAPNASLSMEFARDDRRCATSIRRKIVGIPYVACETDLVDIAVLEIEPLDGLAPLQLLAAGATTPRNVFVVGHPAPMRQTPEAVQAVFGNLDGRKRVSFGKRMDPAPSATDILHDASTVGGYSGAPVMATSTSAVVGLHYYGDPAKGNFAVASATVQTHEVHQYWRQQ